MHAAWAQATQPSIYYVYDDLNRLVAVVDQQGNAATYTYDAVGNILAIERFDISAQPGPVVTSLVMRRRVPMIRAAAKWSLG